MASGVLEGAYVLHSGSYAGYGLRIVYALLGFLTVLCVITGNLMWLVRRAKSLRRIDVLLARLTAGGCGGAAMALAAIFLANQLLPDSLAQRATWEHGVFYAAWCLSVLSALVLPRAVDSARGLLGLAGAVLIAVPLIDAWKNARLPFDPVASPYVFWTELGLVALASLMLASVWAIGRLGAEARVRPPAPDVPRSADGASPAASRAPAAEGLASARLR